MKRFFWLLIRLLTLPCLLNEGLLVLLRLRKQYFDSLTFWLLTAAMCLVPIAGYLLNLCKNQTDNDKRRKNAMIASLVGYCAGTAALLIMRRPAEELIILLTYLISGLLIAFFSLCGVRASGHAAGIAGPFFIAAYLRVMPLFLLLPLFVIIFGLTVAASLRLKRHKAGELLLGAACPIAAFQLLNLIL